MFDCVMYWNANLEATEQQVFNNMNLQLTNQSLEYPIIVTDVPVELEGTP